MAPPPLPPPPPRRLEAPTFCAVRAPPLCAAAEDERAAGAAIAPPLPAAEDDGRAGGVASAPPLPALVLDSSRSSPVMVATGRVFSPALLRALRSFSAAAASPSPCAGAPGGPHSTTATTNGTRGSERMVSPTGPATRPARRTHEWLARTGLEGDAWRDPAAIATKRPLRYSPRHGRRSDTPHSLRAL